MMGRCLLFFFKQKTAYEMRISDWSSDVCSSDLMRVTELVSLNLDSLHMDPPPAWIRCLGKGGKERTIPVHEQAVTTITTYLDDSSEERRVGKECVSPCRSRWSPSH